ncbi:LysR family transcriptional regulator, partial [Paenibacillus sp. 28ISP30-2]|nr:LysR family transcriptional regulator [Paenibacillus sp. 28ISP30-2]
TRFKEICDKPIFLKELVVNYPIILMQKGLNTRKYIDNFFTSYGLKVIPKVELSTMELLIEFAKKGLGISCVIEDFVRSDLDQQQLFIVPIQETIPKRFLSIAIKKDLPLSSAAQRFIELFQSSTV